MIGDNPQGGKSGSKNANHELYYRRSKKLERKETSCRHLFGKE
jgi:hypothetical protein